MVPILKSWMGVKKAHDKLAAFKDKVYEVVGANRDLSEIQLVTRFIALPYQLFCKLSARATFTDQKKRERR